MSHEGLKADDLQIGVNLRAVIQHLQRFPIKGCPLIAFKPLGIHVVEKVAEGTAYQYM